MKDDAMVLVVPPGLDSQEHNTTLQRTLQERRLEIVARHDLPDGAIGQFILELAALPPNERDGHVRELLTAIAQIDLNDLGYALHALGRSYMGQLRGPCAGGCGIEDYVENFQSLDVPGPHGGFCPACYAREHAREQRRLSRRGIRSALSRARAAKLTATLTEAQWQATIEHFVGACAYCGATWYVVEHATPIELGGGTTASNCLPACFACNSSKGTATLEELIRMPGHRWDRDRLTTAHAWLRARGRRTSAGA